MARRLVLWGLLVVLLIGAAGLPVYVYPVAADKPHRSDVIMVLGGRQDGRERYAISLAEKGLAPTVLISNPYGTDDAYANSICDGTYSVRVVCFAPSPTTTRGEARYLRAQAAIHHWRSAMVVTFTPHVARAEYIVGRCFTGDLRVIDYSPHLSPYYWGYMYLYQTAGFVRAFAQDGC
ncbi:YdcF family protein [Williamsia sp. CHRR-6]|nr:YdcF family protein [Williamsia sp. CHRR-6]